MLAGCGGSQPPIGAPGAMPQSRAIATHADRAGSWMLPEAKSEDLLYVTDPQPPVSKVLVFSYPRGRFVGALRFGEGLPGAECSDKDGNVFITDGSYVFEYVHGGKKPLEKLSYSGLAGGCSWDPTTGDLAVPYYAGSSEAGWVAVFKDAKGMPTVYQTRKMAPFRCGYDNAGNLFVDGQSTEGSESFEFAELPKNGDGLKAITLNESFKWPGPVQWDGKYVTVGDNEANPEIIYRFVVSGSEGTSVGATTLSGAYPAVIDWWIQGKRLVGADGLFTSPAVYYWSYPAGGSPTKTITKHLITPLGVTISVAK